MKQKDNMKNANFIRRLPVQILIVGLFLCCLYALHDMQTAEGIGLYFALKLGLGDRFYMDVLVDVLALLCLALLLWLPCLLLKQQKELAFCRLFIGYLAMVPSLSLSKVLHMFRGERIFLWESAPGEEIIQWFWDSVESLQIWLPLLILLYAVRGCVMQCAALGKWHKGVWLGQGILLVLSLGIPAIRHFAGYLVGYLGLLLAFDCWEQILQENAKVEKWSRILFVLLLLRGIYRIMILVSLV